MNKHDFVLTIEASNLSIANFVEAFNLRHPKESFV